MERILIFILITFAVLVEIKGLTCYECYDTTNLSCNWDNFNKRTITCSKIQMYCVIQTGNNNTNDVHERTCASRHELKTSGYKTSIGCQRSILPYHGKAFICIGDKCNEGTFEGHCEGKGSNGVLSLSGSLTLAFLNCLVSFTRAKNFGFLKT